MSKTPEEITIGDQRYSGRYTSDNRRVWYRVLPGMLEAVSRDEYPFLEAIAGLTHELSEARAELAEFHVQDAEKQAWFNATKPGPHTSSGQPIPSTPNTNA